MFWIIPPPPKYSETLSLIHLSALPHFGVGENVWLSWMEFWWDIAWSRTTWGLFLESPGNLTGQKSYFELILKKRRLCSNLQWSPFCFFS